MTHRVAVRELDGRADRNHQQVGLEGTVHLVHDGALRWRVARRAIQGMHGDDGAGEGMAVGREHVDDQGRAAGDPDEVQQDAAGQHRGHAAARERAIAQACRKSHSRTRILAASPAWLLRWGTSSSEFMRSFRKRLLVLIIGLIVVTQTVTLAAVLASTRRTVEARSWEQLRAGATLADQLVRFRAGQLANGVVGARG